MIGSFIPAIVLALRVWGGRLQHRKHSEKKQRANRTDNNHHGAQDTARVIQEGTVRQARRTWTQSQ